MREKLDQPVVLNQFTIWLKVPDGLSVEETHRRMQAAMFIINGAQRAAAVEVQIGPKLKWLLAESQALTNAEVAAGFEKLVSRPINNTTEAK